MVFGQQDLQMAGAEAARPRTIGGKNLSGQAAEERASGKASSSEPSMDEILASIRKIIADQNDEADRAAAKAAADVANPELENKKVESIIGSVAADHWQPAAGNLAIEPSAEHKTASVPQPPVEIDAATAPRQALENKVATAPQAIPASLELPDDDLASLEELIDLIAAVPAAPVPVTKSRNYADRGTDVKSRVAVVPIVQEQPALGEPAEIGAPSARPKPIEREQQTVPHVAPPAPGLMPRADPASALDRLLASKAGKPTAGVTDAPPATQSNDELPGRLPVDNPLRGHAQAKPDYAGTGGDVHQDIRRLREGQVSQRTPPTAPVRNIPTAVAPEPMEAGNFKASVNTTFERLARSMLDERKGEVNDMMTEVMRPIMREWLENNLPSLVERIVREEIERVSRGTHRQN